MHVSIDAPVLGTPPPARHPAHAVLLLLLDLFGRALLRDCHPQSNPSRLALPAMSALALQRNLQRVLAIRKQFMNCG